MHMKQMILVLIVLALSTVLLATEPEAVAPKITFIELGSHNCIPCKQMVPVMEEIETKFGDQVEVIIYDVWTAEHRKYVEQYDVNLIPTQVFLDESGKEIFRHEGFLPSKDIIALFAEHGVQPIAESTSAE